MAITLEQYIRPADKSILGLHWTPIPGHASANLTWALDRCADMGIRWITLLDDGGGSTLQANSHYGGLSIIDMLLARGIIPVVRIYAAPWAKFDSRFEDTTRRLVERGVRYIFWINEPECDGEWKGHVGGRPRDWVRQCTRLCVDGAYKMLALGAYPGWWATTTWRFPDADGNIINPFLEHMTEQERLDIFINGYGWIPLHNYPKNHPLDYPYDAVNQTGQHLTHEEYVAKLAEVDAEYRARTGDLWVWDDYQVDEHHINFVRDRGVNAGATLETDDVSFRMYQGINTLLADAGLLDYVPIISTEIGPCVGERDDGRYPRVTPQEQIRMIDAMLAEAAMVPNYFAMTFWLAGVQRLAAATADGFEDQGWWTDRHNDPFRLQGELPIVQHLIDRNAGLIPPVDEPEEPEEPDDADEDPQEETPVSESVTVNDAGGYGVAVESCTVKAGERFWKVIRVHHLLPAENQGNHNLYVNVFDENGEPYRNARVLLYWPDGEAVIPLEKEWPRALEMAMGNGVLARNAVSVRIVDTIPSDAVHGLHTNHGDEAGPHGENWNSNGHHSFRVEFQLCTKAGETAAEEPAEPVVPTEVTVEDIRKAAWNAAHPTGGVRYNPTAALLLHARERDLGAAVTNEFDIGSYRVQGFALGIVCAVIGDWGNVTLLAW